jgi:uncharacterized protein (DUF362 family)
MIDCNRRVFLKTALASAAVQELMPGSRLWAASGQPELSIMRYGSSPTEPEGIQEEARRLTRSAIEALGGMGRFIAAGDVVWIKPNIAWSGRPQQAATTNPDVVATVVKMCFEAGAGEVHVSDNTCHKAQRTFPRSGIQQAAEAEGAEVALVDKRKFRKMAIGGKVLKEWEIYVDMVEADKFINIPIVKHHSLCQATLGMKNLMGTVGGRRDRFHQDLDNTVSDLAAFIKPDLVVLDAIRVLTRNGPIGGSPADVSRKEVVAAGTDQVAIDAFGASLLGHPPDEIGYIKEASARGLGTADYASLSHVEREI